MNDDNEVGYGKPPKTCQWPKGQSGNPRGRPKSLPEHIDTFAKILSEPVTGRRADGKAVTLGALEAAYLQLCSKALKGDNAALFEAVKLMLNVLPDGFATENERANEHAGARRRFFEMAGVPLDFFADG